MTEKTAKQTLWDWLKSEDRHNNQRTAGDSKTVPNRAARRAAAKSAA